MNARNLGLLIAATFAALALAVALAPTARSQVQATPSFTPIGVSSSGNTSTVWFHEPSSRQAVACQTVQQGASLSSIQCVVTKLP
ncbi:hypothetical protein [Variovorax sp. YR752]|uniref:hypothetical protein n=1 Tax=Variovorax sp. YR752 TaxID=1884383 RepID=UPI00313810C6